MAEILNYLGYNTTYNDEEKLYRYRLNSQNIKYAVNPAAGLELSSLSSSIVLTGKDSFIAEATRRVITSNGIQTIKIGNNVLFPNFFRFTEANKSRLPNAQTNLDIIGLLEDTSQVKQFVRYESPYLSLTCMNDYVLSFLSLGLREPKVEVKILARFKRKSDPGAEDVVFMSTYEVKIQNVSSDIPMTQLSTIPRSVNVTTNEIYELDPNCSASHSLHDPCPMIGIGVGQNLNIVALEKITISGKFFPANSMSFIAGKEIEILPNTEMPPNAHLEIRPILNCGGILPAATNNEITTFCTNKQKYNPIYVAKNRQDTVKKELVLLDVSVFPNPTQHNINVEISTSSKENLRIILQNTLGQIIYQKEIEPNESGSYQETIGTDNLPTGIYYLTLQTKNGIKTQKVLKTN